MKGFKQVEATREAYHWDSSQNSVHRSSLTVPAMPGCRCDISFLNHFLLKRGYTNIACRVTSVDGSGERIAAKLFPVGEPRVYNIALTDIFGERACMFLVEFYAAENLFIPFPAVVINHRGPGFVNSVHAYNRMLNDVFEDDDINGGILVPEASIDIDCGGDLESFLLFSTGPQPIKEGIALELASEHGVNRKIVPVDMPRFCNRDLIVGELFGKFPDFASGGNAVGVLKVSQPRQPMFYGRLLVGRRDRNSVFAANHSYYDSSSVAEYWDDDDASYRTYPYFHDLGNRVRVYPIMSPGCLTVEVLLFGRGGNRLARVDCGSLDSPGTRLLEINIDACIEQANIDPNDIGSFALIATPVEGNTPTRINHQLIFGDGLFTSINVSLKTANSFAQRGRTGLTWGQVLAGGNSASVLGIVGDDPDGPAEDVEVVFYDETGEVARADHRLATGGAIVIDSVRIDGIGVEAHEDGNGRYLWFTARSRRPDLSSFSVSRHQAAGQFTGEHGF